MRGASFFNVVFFAVLVSTVARGTTFEWVARRLGVTTGGAPRRPQRPGRHPPARRGVVEFGVRPGDAAAGRRVRDLAREALLNLMVRGRQAIPPRGSTTVLGPVAVAERVRTRRDRPGSLVVLADGRWAFVGTTVAVGSARAVQDAARRRLARATDDADRTWSREVVGTLAG